MSDKVMLISPVSGYHDERISQPLGIASIASELRHGSYDISLIDGNYLAKKHGYDKVLDIICGAIEKEQPRVVGCSYYGDTEESVRWIADSAISAGSHLILGGHYATERHKKLAENLYKFAKKYSPSSRVALVRREGEKTAKELVDALYKGRDLHGIKGVTFYDGKELVINPDRELADLNELIPPALDLLPPVKEYSGLYYPIEESRGCVFNCSFCSIKAMYPDYRLKTPERIGYEAEKAEELGMERVHLIGELFLLNKRRALEIADILKSLGLGWKMDAHPSLVLKRKDILSELKAKGLYSIEMGAEAATQSSLDDFNKGTTPRKNENAIKIIEQNGIKIYLDFISFQPYMTMKDLEKNFDFIAKHFNVFYSDPNYPLNISHAWKPDEGTPFFKRTGKDGLLKRSGYSYKVKYKDEGVAQVKKGFQYFISKYLKEYRRRDEEIHDICKREDVNGVIPDKTQKKLSIIGTLPATVLDVAYYSAMHGVKDERYIDSLTRQVFEAYDTDSVDLNLHDIYKGLARKIRRAKRRRMKKEAKALKG